MCRITARKYFSPRYISCLDKSMMKWVNKYTCPGFMFVPHNPQPFVKEWHTIACSDSGILFCVKLVEGKDVPAECLPKKYSEKGKTVSLMLHLTKMLHGTGKIVVLDSGFCVPQGLVDMKKKGQRCWGRGCASW